MVSSLWVMQLCRNRHHMDRMERFSRTTTHSKSGAPDVPRQHWSVQHSQLHPLPQTHLGKDSSDMSPQNPLSVALLSHFQELLGTGHLSPPTDQETEEAQQASSPHHLCPSHRSASPGPHGARANPGEKSLAKTSFWQANLAVHITKTFQPSHLSSLHYYGTAHHYYKNHCSTTACSHPNLRL